MLLTNRLNNLLDGFAAIKSRVHPSALDAEFSRPLRCRHRSPSVGQYSAASPIRHLLLKGSPAAIARFIVTVVVNAINAVLFGWTPPHVFDESQETLRTSPSLAYGNPSSAVVAIAWMSWVVASSDHVYHAILFRDAGQAVLHYRFSPQAATAFSVAGAKRVRVGHYREPTIAHTFNSCQLPEATSHLNNDKPSESLPGKVDRARPIEFPSPIASARFVIATFEVSGFGEYFISAVAATSPCGMCRSFFNDSFYGHKSSETNTGKVGSFNHSDSVFPHTYGGNH